MKLLLLGLSLGAASIAGVGCHGRTHVGSRIETRSCGYLDVGKGWRVHATRNVNCTSARKLVTSFFVPDCDAAQRSPGKACTVSGYRCVETQPGDDRGLVRCTRPARLVSALSNQ